MKNLFGICIAIVGNARARLLSNRSTRDFFNIGFFGFFSSWTGAGTRLRGVGFVRCVVPFGIDALVIVLAAGYGELFWIFLPLITAASVGGAALTYWVGHTAGDAGLPRLVPAQHLERIKARVDRMGTGALAVAAVLPPPFPLTPVLLTCGALNLDRWKLLTVFGTMRLVRFGTVALLTRQYGAQVLQMIDADVVQTTVRSLMLVGLGALSVAGAVVWSRTRPQAI